jgi:multicomponent Na+:H+ antiporter subunit E
MSDLALNALLAVLWMLLHASFTMATLAVGFLIGFVAIVFARCLERRGDIHAAIGILHLCGVFLVELVLANLTLARDILRPVPAFQPALLRIGVTGLSPSKAVVLAEIVSLTPGTITVDMVDDGRAIYVHTLYARDPADVRRAIERFAHMLRRIGGSRLPREGCA